MTDPAAPRADALAWFSRFRSACLHIADEIADMPPAERARVVGHGAGGDRTLHVDQLAEDIIIGSLEDAALSHDGLTILSEEVGQSATGGGGLPIVVIDPIDGSLNAKRGIPAFATSIAIADGPNMGDVTLGYVYDYGTGNEFTAEAGRGAWLNGEPMSPVVPHEALRVVALEGAYPHRLAQAALELGQARRLRMIGALALSLCTTAAGWADGMAGLGGGRSVDVAAGQLIARECGVHVMTLDGPLEDYPLDVASRRFMIACANPDHADTLVRAVQASRDAN